MADLFEFDFSDQGKAETPKKGSGPTAQDALSDNMPAPAPDGPAVTLPNSDGAAMGAVSWDGGENGDGLNDDPGDVPDYGSDPGYDPYPDGEYGAGDPWGDDGFGAGDGRNNLYFIPPGAAFADLIARQLIAETADDAPPLGDDGVKFSLADYVLMVPNRRSVKVMRDAFLRQARGAVTLLPTIRPLGEADEDELAIYGEGGQDAALSLPPAIPDLQRKLLLTRLVMARPDHSGKHPTADQAARLADELARFLDQVQTEKCDFGDLKGLVPEEFAQHWQLTLEFLQILTVNWPGILAAGDVSDRAMRRNALIASQIAVWAENPPRHPVIVAGSTGPFPALRDLMAAVRAMPQGRVVLPGLMTGLAPADWAAIANDAAHPQHLLGKTLRHMECDPAQARLWPAAIATVAGDAAGDAADRALGVMLRDDGGKGYRGDDRDHRDQGDERRRLARESLRPARTTDQWRFSEPFAPDVLDGVLRIDCSGAREEAATIALIMRDALETPEKTCALVTPDRGLARRVATELRRWQIDIDDSAGIPLHDTVPAIFLRLVVRAVQEKFAPVPLLELLKHPFSAAGMAPETFRGITRDLEKSLLRGSRPGPGLEGLQAALDQWQTDEVDRIERKAGEYRDRAIAAIDTRHAKCAGLIARLGDCLAPLADLAGNKSLSPIHILRSHITAAEALASTAEKPGHEVLWQGEAGEELADFTHNLLQALAGFDAMPGSRYGAFIDALMADRAVRPRFGKHPRLFIWGTVEAQMQQADLTILGGLNEGVWPPEAGADPWMSRPMRRDFGLPAPEHRVGQSAHDFQQLFCAPEVIMTRALRIDGTPTVPSRWLLRIENLLRKSGIAMEKPAATVWRAMAEMLDEPAAEMYRKIGRPAPRPPVAARPGLLSVTQIETWMRDPYAIYARHILKLQKLDAIDEDPGAADYGNLIHDALDRFVAEFPTHLPPDGEHRLIMIGRDVFRPLAARPGLWAFWWPRFERIAKWFIQTEAARRDHIRQSYTEQSGTLETATGFRVFARADRIDVLRDGGIAIVDYKTGTPPSQGDVANGFAPQLPLEAAIAQQGGFHQEGSSAHVPAGPAASMAFWKLSGGEPAGEIIEINTGKMKTTPAELARAAVDGVNELARAFGDENTPYYSVPHPDHAPKYSDYLHLARYREWMGSDDGETSPATGTDRHYDDGSAAMADSAKDEDSRS